MSRTRIVGGVYTKITGGDYKMYTEGDTIISAAGKNDFANAEKVIIGTNPEKMNFRGKGGTLLITKVESEPKGEVLPNQKVIYKVTEYSEKEVTENDKNRIQWAIKIDDKQEVLKEKGEKLKLTIKEEWAGKEIIVMPFLVKPDEEKVSKKTKIIVKMAIIFVNGYWNTGKTVGNKVGKINEKLGKSIEEIIRDNTGDKFGEAYWMLGFKIKAFEYFKRRLKEMYNFEIPEDYQTLNKKYIKDIYIDGADVWSSTGQLRFDKGFKEAMSDKFKTDLKDKGILSQENKKQAPIFVVSHSMGGAHAEGIVQGLLTQGIEVDRVLHFSPADNEDFKITLPNKTYQINILPDIVLMYKNFNDVVSTLPKKIWDGIRDIFSKKETLEKNSYQINGLKNEHFKLKISSTTTNANHYYTKSIEVWELVEFLKE